MNRIVIVFAVMLAAISPSWAAGATLDVSTKAAYDRSIAAMTDELPAAKGMNLVFAILILATAVDEVPAVMAQRFNGDDELFLERLRPFQGKTASELLELAAARR